MTNAEKRAYQTGYNEGPRNATAYADRRLTRAYLQGKADAEKGIVPQY